MPKGKSIPATTKPAVQTNAHAAEMKRRADNMAKAAQAKKNAEEAHKAEMARRANNLRKQKSGY